MPSLLRDELEWVRAPNARLTDHRVVLATIPATTDAEVPTVSLLADVDIAP